MRLFLFLLALNLTLVSFSQIYNNPTTTNNTCSGSFFDQGGSAGNYTKNVDRSTTFCSNAGNCLRVSFTSFSTELNDDVLVIYDGNSTAATIIGIYSGTTSPGIVLSSSGCLTFRFIADNDNNVSAGWASTISCVPCPGPATYTHPTTMIANEFVGSCLVNNCGPFTYTDNGNTTGAYANNIGTPGQGGIYRVFCPSVAGNCMRVTFNTFGVENVFDYMTIGNGPTQNSTFFTTAPAAANGRITGYPTVPFSYTSTDPSGCLTFRFFSDFTGVTAGWHATMQCVPCAGGPNGTDNNDCQALTPLCSGASFNSNSTGPGLVSEGCSGVVCPAGGENHSNWYQFVAQTTGTLNVTITPNNAADDYDFAIYGPNVTCGALGNPLRCSDSGASGITGAQPPGTGNSEDVTGDGLVSQLNVVAGQSYILVVDKWSPALAAGYTLSFGGTASLDCAILPIELAEFNAEYQNDLDIVDVSWITNSEHNSDYFLVEKSTDGVTYQTINRVEAVGESLLETQYYTTDENPAIGVNYYRLKQFDKNGDFKYSDLRSVNILDDVYDMLTIFPNPTKGTTDVIFNSYSKEEVILTVSSVGGTTVINTPLEAKNGGNRFELDMSNQKPGIYFITITTSDKVYTSKLIKE